MNIVILAAGMGKRMHSTLPKVLQPLAGRPMLDHVLETTKGLAKGARVVVVGHCAEMVKARYEGFGDIEYAYQNPPQGTGHALKVALPHISMDEEHTLVCLGDVPLLSRDTISKLSDEASRSDLVLLTVYLDDPTGYGRIIRGGDALVKCIVEEKDANPEERQVKEVNTGIMLLPTKHLSGWLNRLKNDNQQGEYYLTDLIDFAVKDGLKVTTVQPQHEYEVTGVNSKTQLAALERVWQRAQASKLLESGVTILDPDRIDVRGSLRCGKDVVIDVGCIFSGTVEVEDDVEIGAYCVINNAVIKRGTRILPYTHIDGAVVGADCRIGPYSRLRPGAELSGGNHIGNFVEIKKSVVGEMSKVNHLTYIGDSEIGRRVNVGAGTITCNYDGVNKFKTVIGDDAFIGSGTELVAPIKVGDGATIGAGTTLTSDAPAGQLTVGRARQTTLPRWKRPVKK